MSAPQHCLVQVRGAIKLNREAECRVEHGLHIHLIFYVCCPSRMPEEAMGMHLG